MAQASPVQFIGETLRESGDQLVLRDRGGEEVKSLEDLELPEGEHYTDDFGAYTERTQEEIARLKSFDEIRVRGEDGSERILQPFSEVVRICGLVDVEYGATVTPRLQKITGNEAHHVPRLDPDLVFASYVALSAGGATVLPTSVGNIVAAASPRGLDVMFETKQRTRLKPGVVLTTIDEIPNLFRMPTNEDWEGYHNHMHDEGILIGSKLHRNEDHPLFKNQPEWASKNSMMLDGTSMAVTLPGPYSDGTARVLRLDDKLLTASSANISGKGNNRDINFLAEQIRYGVEFVAWDPEAVGAYPLDEEHESQGIMIDTRPYSERYLAARERFNDILEHIGESSEIVEGQRFHVIRWGLMNGPFTTETVAWMRDNLKQSLRITGDHGNIAHLNSLQAASA